MRRQLQHHHDKDGLLKRIVTLTKKSHTNIATIRAVYAKNTSEKWEFLIGSCEVGKKGKAFKAIYSECAYICIQVSNFDLENFIESLDDGGYFLIDNMPPLLNTTKTQMYWDEDVIPSHATISKYPVRSYSARINSSASFSETMLLGFEMPFYPSSTEYTKDFMGMRQFHGNSDGRKGELSIEIIDKRGRICHEKGELSIENGDIDICLVGNTQYQDSISLKPGETIKCNGESLNESELWLLARDNEILDFRSKSEWQYRLDNINNGRNKAKRYLEIIELGENQEVEFKTYIDISKSKNNKAKEIEKTVCAFSNSQGGDMFIGVTDDGCIEGIDEKVREHYQKELNVAIEHYMKALKKRLIEALIDNQCFSISAIKLGEKYVIIISVIRTRELNYNVNSRAAFIRRGATSFKMTSADERKQTDDNAMFPLGL